jgi:hypothetical protein
MENLSAAVTFVSLGFPLRVIRDWGETTADQPISTKNRDVPLSSVWARSYNSSGVPKAPGQFPDR